MSKQPDPRQLELANEVARLRKDLDELRLRSEWTGSGSRPNGAGGVVVDGELIVDGGEARSGNYVGGTSGWHLSGDGKAEFKDVILYDIPNSMLANPVDGKVGNVSATGFSLGSGALVELAFQNVIVPAGFTQALVTAGGSVFSYNPNTAGGSNGAGGDAVYCMVQITTTAGAQASRLNPVGVSGSGGYATSFSGAGFNLTALAGGDTIRLSVYGCSAYQALGANPDNYANAYATVMFLR